MTELNRLLSDNLVIVLGAAFLGLALKLLLADLYRVPPPLPAPPAPRPPVMPKVFQRAK